MTSFVNKAKCTVHKYDNPKSQKETHSFEHLIGRGMMQLSVEDSFVIYIVFFKIINIQSYEKYIQKNDQ